MTWPLILIIAGVVVTLVVWASFVYIAVRGLKTEVPDLRFGPSLDVQSADQPAPMKVLLPIDGSPASVAAVQEVAHCPLPPGSTIELLYAIHSRLPVIPDFPPWAVTIAAAHGESIRAQTQHAPEVLAAAAKHLQAHQPQANIVTRTVEGVPKEEILREAVALGANRIVLGSHGRGRGQRLVLGSTVAAVAADAQCTVQIARPRAAGAGNRGPGPMQRELAGNLRERNMHSKSISDVRPILPSRRSLWRKVALENLGSRVTIDEEPVLHARQIQKGEATWTLRDASGRPLRSGGEGNDTT